jgi:hypothetical protein
MVDTLRIAEDLEAEGFPSGQARKLAKAIASVGDDKRFRELEIKVGVQAVISGLMLAALLAVFWQLYTLRGEVSGLAAENRVRFGILEQKVGTVEQRLGTLEQQVGGLRTFVERLGAPPR